MPHPSAEPTTTMRSILLLRTLYAVVALSWIGCHSKISKLSPADHPLNASFEENDTTAEEIDKPASWPQAPESQFPKLPMEDAPEELPEESDSQPEVNPPKDNGVTTQQACKAPSCDMRALSCGQVEGHCDTTLDCGACEQECGDDLCHITEDCQSCAADCGACSTTPIEKDLPCAFSPENYLGTERYKAGGNRVLEVPEEYATIAAALSVAKSGDVILLAEGRYQSSGLKIPVSVTIASRFLVDGQETHIRDTVIEGRNHFETEPGSGLVEFIGFSIKGGGKPIVARDHITVAHVRFENGVDQLSFESTGYGTAVCNTFTDAGDDGIDVDARPTVKDAFIDILHNTFFNADDDGIEVRLYRRSNGAPNLVYNIHHNDIRGSGEDGIQFIDERAGRNDNTRTLRLFHNLIVDSQEAGIGCMTEMNTIENLQGASAMDEPLYIVNNTIVGGKVGITGGNHTIVLNSIVVDQSQNSIKHVTRNGQVDYSLYARDTTSNAIAGSNNFIDAEPGYDPKTYELRAGSPSIDVGLGTFTDAKTLIFDFSGSTTTGKTPDLGAFEYGTKLTDDNIPPTVSAGPDRVLVYPDEDLALSGIVDDDNRPMGMMLTTRWAKLSGPGDIMWSAPNSLKTDVHFKQMGLYVLQLTANDRERSANDRVVVRYVKDGEGQSFTLQDSLLSFEAEDYSYLFGTAEQVDDQDAQRGQALRSLATEEHPAFADYHITTTEVELVLYAWVRIKGPNEKSNTVDLEFHGSAPTTNSVGVSVTGDGEYRWASADRPFTTEAGSWRLRVKSQEEGVHWDALVLSTNKDFSPNP